MRRPSMFVPQLVAFLLILLIGLFVAKLVAKVNGMVLERVGPNRAVERAGARKAHEKSTFDASASSASSCTTRWTCSCSSSPSASSAPTPISALITSVVAFLPTVIVASTIATAVREAGAVSDRPAARPQLVDEFLPKLEEWIERSKGKLRADRAHPKLAALGYTGSQRTTRRAVAR